MVVLDNNLQIDNGLRKPLDSIIYNMGRDFDFVILITGSGLTRVGKSTLGQQIGTYVSMRLNKPFTVDNIVFGGNQLMDAANKLPRGSVIMDDESREDISGKSQLDYFNKQLLTFFNECGMLNHLIILIATDFFDFNKSIAVTRSELLINCVRTSKPAKDDQGYDVLALDKGNYDLYDRSGKRMLFVTGKKNFDQYNSKYAFANGKFNGRWFVDQAIYEQKKLQFLRRDREKIRQVYRLQTAIQNMKDKHKMSYSQISELLAISSSDVQYYYQGRTREKSSLIIT